MSYNLVINGSNVVNALKNTYRYDFINGTFEIADGSEIMITSLQIPYSWFNITARNNNNSFRFYWPTASATYNTLTINLPDGFYTTTSLNAYIQQFCVANGFYLIENSTQNYLYYINVLFNPTYYANQIILKPVPTVIPAGFTAPPNWAGYPTVSRTPYVEILSTNHFGKFLGFTAGNYGILSTAGGPPTVDYSANSNQTPVGSTVNSLVIRCSLVNNNVSAQTDIIDAFAINNTDFGRNLNFNNNIEKWIKLNAGRYSSFTVSIVDENMNDIQILDSNILINFIIRTKK
jgi:hypothetical protein